MLVWFQLQAKRPNTPFGGVLPHVRFALEWHACVEPHYTPARVAIAAINPNFRMPAEGP